MRKRLFEINVFKIMHAVEVYYRVSSFHRVHEGLGENSKFR